MANTLVEGFATYGTGFACDFGIGSTAYTIPAMNMLSGVFSSVNKALDPLGINPYAAQIGTLPWDLTSKTLYYSNLAQGYNDPYSVGLRRALPATQTEFIMSFHFAISSLPLYSPTVIFTALNGTAVQGLTLGVTPAGYLALYATPAAGAALVGISNGSIIRPQTDYHIELKYSSSGLTAVVHVNGVTVMTAVISGVSVAIVELLPTRYNSSQTDPAVQYISDWIVRDTTGAFNNTFMGDRRVATLFPNADDLLHQGWTAYPLRRFGAGILNLSVALNNCLIGYTPNTFTDLGSGNFTMEASVQLRALPTGGNKSALFGKWDETNNKRSWQLYIGGPTLAGGATVFRISTDGTSVTSVISTTAWAPSPGQWYCVCVERVAGVTTLYVDGVYIASSADANTYYAGTEYTAIGAQVHGNFAFPSAVVVEPNTYFNGFMDEIRLTVGLARYGAPYAKPTTAFPRSGGDANWAKVGLIMGFETGSSNDESSHAVAFTLYNSATVIQPNDGVYAYQTINDNPLPLDANFIEADYKTASGIYTLTTLPTNGNTVTLGTKVGPLAAVYTWKTVLASAFDVLIGADVNSCIVNLLQAVNLIPGGVGVFYGTGTTANLDAVAFTGAVAGSMQVYAITAGVTGNTIASTATGTAGTWGAATLLGGVNLPANSQFYYDRLPTNTNLVDSVTIVARAWKSDAGTANMKLGLIGVGGGASVSSDIIVSTSPTVYSATFDQDPDNPGVGLSPTTISLGRVRVDRTA